MIVFGSIEHKSCECADFFFFFFFGLALRIDSRVPNIYTYFIQVNNNSNLTSKSFTIRKKISPFLSFPFHLLSTIVYSTST